MKLVFRSFFDFGLYYAKKNGRNVYKVLLTGPVAYVYTLHINKPVKENRLYKLIKDRSLQYIHEIKITKNPPKDVTFYVID